MLRFTYSVFDSNITIHQCLSFTVRKRTRVFWYPFVFVCAEPSHTILLFIIIYEYNNRLLKTLLRVSRALCGVRWPCGRLRLRRVRDCGVRTLSMFEYYYHLKLVEIPWSTAEIDIDNIPPKTEPQPPNMRSDYDLQYLYYTAD